MSTRLKLLTTAGLAALLLNLSACVNWPVKLIANHTNYDGLITQSVVFTTKDKQQHQWVCYTELAHQVITGISCQNDTALPLFSGGLVAGEFEFDYPSRFLLKIQPPSMLAYIKMSLFDELHYNSHHISVKKHANHTQIDDYKRKINLTIQTL